jgi:uncharacterized protein (TIGR03382 family)
LPHIDTLPKQLGFATGASQPLQLHNGGAAALMIEVASAPDGVTAEAVTIAPGADGVVQITAADPTSLGSTALVLSTNDPNNPSLTVALDASASGQSNTTSSDGEASGCNASGGGPGGGMLLVGFVLVALAKRRRA